MRAAHRLAVSSLVLLAAACTGGDDDDGGDVRDPRFDALAAQFELERTQLDAPGVSVALIEDGEVVWAEGFGSRLVDGDKPAKASTLYRIGSVNKMLTSAALLRKVDAGVVGTGDAVTEHVPDFHFDLDATWAGSIRIEHLLSHTGGMIDYLTIDGPDADTSLSTFLTGNSPSSFPAFGYLMSPAGRFWNYSNPNFYVAGLVDERTSTGMVYRDLMRQGVFEPLEMDRTFFLADEVLDAGNWAEGDSFDYEDGTSARITVGPESYDNAWGRPAGYAWSSVPDIAKFTQFLLDGNTDVLADATRAGMQEIHVSTAYFLDYSNYGHGLFVDSAFQLGNEWYETKLVSHGGDIPGYAADVYLVPSTRMGLVILSNRSGAHFSESAAMALRDFGTLPAPVAVPDPEVDPADFGDYAATYEDPYNIGTVVITTNATGLTISMPDLDALSIPYDDQLVPYSKDNFVLGVQGFQTLATFFLDTAGNPQYFRTRFAVAEAAPAAFAPAANPVDPERLRRVLATPEELPHSVRERLRVRE